MISINQLTVQFSGTDLFRGISLLISPKDKIGLVGKNGAGKTTLLRVICGLQEPSSGEVVVPPGYTIGYLPQTMHHPEGRSVIEETRTAFGEMIGLQAQLQETEHLLASRSDYHSTEYTRLTHHLSELHERMNLLGAGAMEGELERTLTGLGFQPSEFNRPTRELSGGWRMRIELAKILLRKPELLLLDEPTNHLDIESIEWMEEYIRNFSGAMVLISHDRAFLDNTTSRTVELSLGRLFDYKVSYTQYTQLRRERYEQQMAAYRNQQKMIQDTEEFIERFRYKPTKAVQVQSRIKQLEKIQRIEVDEMDENAMHVRFPPATRSGKVVVEAEGLSKRFGTREVLRNIGLTIHRGEKVAFAGRNGEGKTTLARIIIGELPCEEGRITLGHNVRVGYFAQNQHEVLREDLTVFETIDQIAVGDVRTKIRDLLGAFLFGGSDIDKKVKVLSGGERSRLAMVKLLLEPYNLLILDEPTHHFDMRSKDVLKQALMHYDGTLIIVSHDRDFLAGLTEKVYEFRDRQVREHLGDIYEFLRKKKVSTLLELSRKAPQESSPAKDSGGKLDYLEKKEQEKQIRKAASLVTQSEQTIASLEQQIAEVEHSLAAPEGDSQGDMQDLFETHHRLRKVLDDEMLLWAERTENFEQMQKK